MNCTFGFPCKAKSLALAFLIVSAFVSIRKSFAIAILFHILFLLLSAIFGWTEKCFLPVFNLSLPKTRVTSIGPVSLDTLANVFALVLFTVVLGAGGQYLFNMHVEFLVTV